MRKGINLEWTGSERQGDVKASSFGKDFAVTSYYLQMSNVPEDQKLQVYLEKMIRRNEELEAKNVFLSEIIEQNETIFKQHSSNHDPSQVENNSENYYEAMKRRINDLELQIANLREEKNADARTIIKLREELEISKGQRPIPMFGVTAKTGKESSDQQSKGLNVIILLLFQLAYNHFS